MTVVRAADPRCTVRFVKRYRGSATMVDGPQSRAVGGRHMRRIPDRIQGRPWHIVEVGDDLPMPDIAAGICGALVRFIEDALPSSFDYWCRECLRLAVPPLGG